ncbi:MAG: DNA recombination protein RmuC [Casimicrobiaceae bacterium]
MEQPGMIAIVLLLAIGVVGLLALATFVRLSAVGRALEGGARAATRDAGEMKAKLDAIAAQTAHAESDIRQDLANARNESTIGATALRAEVGNAIGRFRDTTQQQLTDMAGLQQRQLHGFAEQLDKLTISNEQRLDALRLIVEQRLETLRLDNTAKLEQMRATVDEKLQTTLEQRLGESFKLVSDRLDQVHKGLGEMQTLAVGVGDLKRVLGNVKTRGGWGEVQLAALLAEMLTPQQFGTNVETRPGSGRRVEFAVRLPGKTDDEHPCWLPIDAKFPLDHWQRLQDALAAADVAGADQARRTLADVLRVQARAIREAYVEPPYTTDFAILFVPTEGLYAEMMARPGFAEALQREYRVLLTGPMNLAALLNSLQMGFRTLAIEQRGSEVWKVLGAVKAEFGKFGDVLARTKEKLDQASKTIDDAGVRSRAIVKQLRNVESLPEPEAVKILTGAPRPEAGSDSPPGTLRPPN